MAQLDLLYSAPLAMPPVSTITMTDKPSPEKALGAYKTISEVSEELAVPQHVLRFWESHFPQVKPSRMRGSRRYYRPEDVDALKTIKTLLYSKGYTIKGAKQAVRDAKHAGADAPSSRAVASAALPSTAAAAKSKGFPATSGVKGKKVDVKSLVTELRVLKSMLTSLL